MVRDIQATLKKCGTAVAASSISTGVSLPVLPLAMYYGLGLHSKESLGSRPIRDDVTVTSKYGTPKPAPSKVVPPACPPIPSPWEHHRVCYQKYHCVKETMVPVVNSNSALSVDAATTSSLSSSSNPHNETPQTTTPTHSSRSVGGIDIHQALSILSSRSEQQQQQQQQTPSGNQPTSRCGCFHGIMDIPDTAKTMGQSINMLAGPVAAGEGPRPKSPESSIEQENERLRVAEQHQQQLQKIQSELKSMSNKDLLRAVLRIQEDRVVTYRDYEK
jgi:hypothetical protein